MIYQAAELVEVLICTETLINEGQNQYYINRHEKSKTKLPNNGSFRFIDANSSNQYVEGLGWKWWVFLYLSMKHSNAICLNKEMYTCMYTYELLVTPKILRICVTTGSTTSLGTLLCHHGVGSVKGCWCYSICNVIGLEEMKKWLLNQSVVEQFSYLTAHTANFCKLTD